MTPANLKNRTTLWSGAGVSLVALVWFGAYFEFAIPFSGDSVLPFGAIVPSAVVSVIGLLAFILLAFGVRGEGGIAGRSAIARVALVVYGYGLFGFSLLNINNVIAGLFTSEPAPTMPSLVVSAVSECAFAAAGVVAAIMVFRSRFVSPLTRWAFLIFVVLHTLGSSLVWVPVGALSPIVPHFSIIFLATLLLFGVVTLLNGQSAAIHSHWRIIEKAW